MYQHHNWQGALLDYPVSKVVCVGSNYANHIKEMGSAVPEEPVLFIKPETALCDLRQPLAIPSDFGSVHHEVELAVLIGATPVKTKLKNITSIFKLSKCQPTGTLPVINVNAPLLSVAQEVNDE